MESQKSEVGDQRSAGNSLERKEQSAKGKEQGAWNQRSEMRGRTTAVTGHPSLVIQYFGLRIADF